MLDTDRTPEASQDAPTPAEHFVIVKRTDLSLEDVLALRRRGESVMRTPHVGNQNPVHLLWHRQGGRSVLYDRTLGGRDRNFNPHGIIRGGSFHRVAADDVLLTHARVERQLPVAPHVEAGARLADAHTAQLRRVAPAADVEHYTDYLRARVDRALAIVERVTQAFPWVWERTVTAEGRVQQHAVPRTRPVDPDVPAGILARGVYGLTDEQQGWVIPNVLNVLLVSVLDAQEVGTDRVYHVSGPDMIHYIDRLAGELDQLYDHVRRSFPEWHLPTRLEFHLIPMAELRLVVVQAERAALDAAVGAYLRDRDARRTAQQRLAGSAPLREQDRRQAIAESTSERTRAAAELREALPHCRSIFFDTRHRSHVSQHDLTDASQELYAHPLTTHAPVADVAQAMQFLRRGLEQLHLSPAPR